MSRPLMRAAGALVLAAVACAAPGPGSPPAPVDETPRAPLAAGGGSPLVAEILASHPGLTPVAARAGHHRLQVVVGLLEPGRDGGLRLVQHPFRAGPGAEYFYPASTVKLFAAVAALERLGELRRETGLPIDADTRLVFHPLFPGEEREEATVRRDVRAIFLVSDNAAYNRLYELVGPDRLAASLARAGLAEVRIVHRLSERRTAEENRRSPRIELVGDGFRHVIEERLAPPPPAPPVPPPPGLAVGKGHVDGDGSRIERPMDFSGKNRAGLATLQRGLCRVLRPDVDCGGGAGAFTLSGDDRALLAEAMGQVPRESADPSYDPALYPDDYVKLVLPGIVRVPGAEGVRVYDKSGQAYGFTTENAYVVDPAGGRAFFLAATLYTNADGVVNDDRYEYDEIALPFLADLGEAVARRLWAAGDGGP